MAQRWYSCHLDHQTVVFGPKGRTGPSPEVMEQLRWAGARVSEGGGALHTHTLLSGQVNVIRGCGREGGGVESRWWGGGARTGRTARPLSPPSIQPLVEGTPGGCMTQHREEGGAF